MRPMKARKSFLAEDVIAPGVGALRQAASSITNQTMQAIIAKWEEIEFRGGLRDSRKLRESIYEIVLANIVENYAGQGSAE